MMRLTMLALLLTLPLLPVAKAEALEPELIAPGVVSTQNGEYSPTFDPSRNELIFMRRTPGLFDYTLYSSTLSEEGWSTPVVLPFSGEYRDAGPSLSTDGNTLVFDSRRPHPELTGDDIDLWRVVREGDGWGTPSLILEASVNPADEPDAQRDEFGPVITDSGDVLWYSFRRPDRGGAFYRLDSSNEIQREDDLPDPSAATFIAYFSLSSDGKLAVLEGRSLSGRDSDLYYSCHAVDGWSDAAPLDAINSTNGEGGPYLTPDGESLFFVSDRPTTAAGAGDANLYRVAMTSLAMTCP